VDDRQFGDFARFLAPMLVALEGLAEIARDLYPTPLSVLLDVFRGRAEDLANARPDLSYWPDDMDWLRRALNDACDHILTAYQELDAIDPLDPKAMGRVGSALRGLPRAEEELYPLAPSVTAVSRFFLPPARQQDDALGQKLADAPHRNDTGVIHLGDPPGTRGGASLYIPEYYSEDREWPLVVALHGGIGSSRSFLWNWLRDARAEGAIVAAVTARDYDGWSFSGPDEDRETLRKILEIMHQHWRIDPKRILLTGMSDGGTYTYVAGLEPGLPFTHLAPVAATFHPMLAQMADPERVAGLPIHIVHGAHDWMFPVETAHAARDALTAAGADVTYREVPDLAHNYPREVNPEILAWLNGDANGQGG
jgi:phospholipase/carboxylesterase